MNNTKWIYSRVISKTLQNICLSLIKLSFPSRGIVLVRSQQMGNRMHLDFREQISEHPPKDIFQDIVIINNYYIQVTTFHEYELNHSPVYYDTAFSGRSWHRAKEGAQFYFNCPAGFSSYSHFFFFHPKYPSPKSITGILTINLTADFIHPVQNHSLNKKPEYLWITHTINKSHNCLYNWSLILLFITCRCAITRYPKTCYLKPTFCKIVV